VAVSLAVVGAEFL